MRNYVLEEARRQRKTEVGNQLWKEKQRQKGEPPLENEDLRTSAALNPTNALDLIPVLETQQNHSYWS